MFLVACWLLLAVCYVWIVVCCVRVLFVGVCRWSLLIAVVDVVRSCVVS